MSPYNALSIDDKATKESDCVFRLSDTVSAGFSVSLLDCSLIYKLKTIIGNFKSTLFQNDCHLKADTLVLKVLKEHV